MDQTLSCWLFSILPNSFDLQLSQVHFSSGLRIHLANRVAKFPTGARQRLKAGIAGLTGHDLLAASLGHLKGQLGVSDQLPADADPIGPAFGKNSLGHFGSIDPPHGHDRDGYLFFDRFGQRHIGAHFGLGAG